MLRRGTAKANRAERCEAMPEGVPLVTDPSTFVLITFRYIDANGTPDAFSVRSTPARATPAAIEAATVALGAATNAFVYEVWRKEVWATSPSPTSAIDAPRESANDVIETLTKDLASGAAQYFYIPAPLDELFVEGTNDVIIDSDEYVAVKDAFDALLPSTYQARSVRFAEHKNLAEKSLL